VQKTELKPLEAKAPVAVVCVSGGGIRAAAWTLAMLRTLEERFALLNVPFPYRILLFTGASGGMVGAASYTAALETPDPTRSPPVRRVRALEDQDEVRAFRAKLVKSLPPAAPPGFQEYLAADSALARLSHRICEDCLTPVVNQMIYDDLLTAFWPGRVTNDRGRALEAAWEGNLDALLEKTFSEMYEGEAAGWRPHLLFSPMLVEDGRLLWISNLDLGDVALNCGNIFLEQGRQDRPVISCKAVEFFRLFPEAHAGFKLRTAARLSASFPYISPAAALPTDPRRRVVDAGYYDNYGVSTAAAWLLTYRDWLRDNAAGVALIQIRDDESEPHRAGANVPGQDSLREWLLDRSLEWLTDPAAGLLSARTASMSYRNDQQLALLGDAFRRPGDPDECPFFVTAAFELGAKDVSLSWYLTNREKERIEREARKLDKSGKMGQLLWWWQQRPGIDHRDRPAQSLRREGRGGA
jgi:hypothetical protein